MSQQQQQPQQPIRNTVLNGPSPENNVPLKDVHSTPDNVTKSNHIENVGNISHQQPPTQPPGSHLSQGNTVPGGGTPIQRPPIQRLDSRAVFPVNPRPGFQPNPNQTPGVHPQPFRPNIPGGPQGPQQIRPSGQPPQFIQRPLIQPGPRPGGPPLGQPPGHPTSQPGQPFGTPPGQQYFRPPNLSHPNFRPPTPFPRPQQLSPNQGSSRPPGIFQQRSFQGFAPPRPQLDGTEQLVRSQTLDSPRSSTTNLFPGHLETTESGRTSQPNGSSEKVVMEPGSRPSSELNSPKIESSRMASSRIESSRPGSALSSSGSMKSRSLSLNSPNPSVELNEKTDELDKERRRSISSTGSVEENEHSSRPESRASSRMDRINEDDSSVKNIINSTPKKSPDPSQPDVTSSPKNIISADVKSPLENVESKLSAPIKSSADVRIKSPVPESGTGIQQEESKHEPPKIAPQKSDGEKQQKIELRKESSNDVSSKNQINNDIKSNGIGENSVTEIKTQEKPPVVKNLELRNVTSKIRSPAKSEGDNDSGVDESTQGNDQSSNGDHNSPRKSSGKIPVSRTSSTTPTKNSSRSLSRGSKSPNIKSPDSTASTPGSTEKKKLPMNKVQVGSAPSPNLKVVRSKIGSLENASYKPGGGHVKIENKKLDWSAAPRIEAKNDKYAPKGGDKKITQQKLQWNAKPKVGSLENATHRPKGGDKKIESIKLDFKDKAKPKVGSKDNLKHVPGGGDIKIENKKIDLKVQSKVGSMDNVKHKPGGGDKKIFDDKEYLKQMSGISNEHSLSGSQNSLPSQPEVGGPVADENLNRER